MHKISAVMLGAAVGDALGVPAEFSEREELLKNPITDMVGYGAHSVPAGTWSDDTSLSIAALDVLADGIIDYNRIMENFGKWFYHAAYTATDEVFDCGQACGFAIDEFVTGHKPPLACGRTAKWENGNGSLMRIHPFVLYLAEKDLPLAEKIEEIHRASSLTHAHLRSKVGCGIYALVLWELLRNPCKDAVAKGLAAAAKLYTDCPEIVAYARLFEKDFAALPSEEIESTGYVVHTLEAALWCLLNTDSYADCVCKAVSLGHDADTTACVAGGLAGALYGEIPERWLLALRRREVIEEMCRRAEANW